MSSVAFCPTAKGVLAVGYRGAGVAVYSTAHLLPIATLDDHPDVLSVAWAATRVVLLDGGGGVHVWEVTRLDEGRFQQGATSPMLETVIKEGAVALARGGVVVMDNGRVVAV